MLPNAVNRLLFLILLVGITSGQDAARNRISGGERGDDDWTLKRDEADNIIREANYIVLAGRTVRPGQRYQVVATLLRAHRFNVSVKASVQRNGVDVGSAKSSSLSPGIPTQLLIRIPAEIVTGDFKLRVEGIESSASSGTVFLNETSLIFSQRSMTIFIQTDKPIYMQGQKVNFRAIPVNTELKSFDGAIDVYMIDPKGNIMRRWLSRQTNLGTVSLNYQLSDQPKFGKWTIRVVALNQVEESSFVVEEYYQTRFEVNVTTPAFFFTTEKYIYGTVMANYTSGAPVRGNLTLKATLRPIGGARRREIDGVNLFDRYLHLEEDRPSWIPITYERDEVPHLKYFYGVYNFRFPMEFLQTYSQSIENFELMITATVGERFLDEKISAISISRIYNSSVQISFLGGSPKVFKPSLPTTIYMAASYHDGSPIHPDRLTTARMEVSGDVQMKTQGRRSIETRYFNSSTHKGLWSMRVDLLDLLGLQHGRRTTKLLSDVEYMKITASYRDDFGGRDVATLLMMAPYSKINHQINVETTTKDATVGNFLILSVKTNVHIEKFDYIVSSKGNILLYETVPMKKLLKTFALSLSPEMSPLVTVTVFAMIEKHHIIVDSLTVPVNGISRFNFTVNINNKKARTGEQVEVEVYGRPGAYVGLSGIDKPFFSMQAGNELTYAKAVSSLAAMDDSHNGTNTHVWHSHQGDPDELVHFPTSSFGIDANRTFSGAGLVVFTDAIVERRPELCNNNASQALGECLNGACFNLEKRCDGYNDCEDGSDETQCATWNETDIGLFRKYRFSRVQRHYENVWLWKDINIGPLGRNIFQLDVPPRPAHWMISAFGVDRTYGFGMIRKPIEYLGVLPFYMNVEMPSVICQGEQVGIRVSVFNYMTYDYEVTVALAHSDDYKFVHVEQNGIVRSYNPRTSHTEFQFFLYMKAQDSAILHLPIVPVRLGDITVSIWAQSPIGRDVVNKTFHVIADGLPQYRHESILLDLKSRAYVPQYMHVNVTDTPIIPYSEDRYYVFGSNKAYVTAVGDVVGPVFPHLPMNASSMLNLPTDGAEQTAYSLAVYIYTLFYTRLISQRDIRQEKEAFKHMNIAYQKLMSFFNEDGSFSMFRSDWGNTAPSVWLTAYCTRLLQEASFPEWENYIYIDPKVIAKAAKWLLSQQAANGSFVPIHSMEDQRRASNHIVLTSHVVIMLKQLNSLSASLGIDMSSHIKAAQKYLEDNLSIISKRQDPYEIAITAYALTVTGSYRKNEAHDALERSARHTGGLMYWGKEEVPAQPFKLENQKPFLMARLPYRYDASNIETTAFALMTLVTYKWDETHTIVEWLNSQRLTDGGWASTQDSAWAMKALIEYTNQNHLKNVSDMTLIVEASSIAGSGKKLKIQNRQLAKLQRLDIPNAWGTVKVQARGTGYAILQMTVQYNVDIPRFQTQPPVRCFDLVTKAIFHGRNQSHITYNSCQRWTHTIESNSSGLTVLDVTIPTGYFVHQKQLDAYVLSGNVRNLKRARYEERKVLFYFDHLDERDTCVNFTIERWHPVANMSRYLPVRVYEYYAPERYNETIFDAVTTYLLNICEVCGSSQCPYCYIYSLGNLTQPSIFFILFSIIVSLLGSRFSLRGTSTQFL